MEKHLAIEMDCFDKSVVPKLYNIVKVSVSFSRNLFKNLENT